MLDKSPKTQNDRTWCFWEKVAEPGPFEPLIHKYWDDVYFHGEGYSRLFTLSPYRYKLIRSIDFYQAVFAQLKDSPEVEIRYGHIGKIKDEGTRATVSVDGDMYSAGYVFNSLPLEKMPFQPGKHYLLQHFKGWWIKTENPVFDARNATLMDFRVSQKHGTAFVYVLPLNARRALVEYTIFSPAVLDPEAYDEGLRAYVKDFLNGGHYQIEEEEFGVIPMTNHVFPTHRGRIVYIGTAGGQTKPSTGYTFRFIQKHSQAIASAIKGTGKPYVKKTWVDRRFHFYDSTLLRILSEEKLGGKEIFTRMFQRNAIQDVLKFLDNETTLWEDWRITTTLQKRVFVQAVLKELIIW